MVECAGLEIQCTVMLYREFESHPFRQKFKVLRCSQKPLKSGFLHFGVENLAFYFAYGRGQRLYR